MNERFDSIRPPCEEVLLSVVCPVYNEARALPVLAARIAEVLNACPMQYEIVFVDDGSEDDSPRILDQLAASSDKVRVIHLSRNFGQQAAVQAGLRRARGDVVVLMDSDMQDNPKAVPDFMAEWRNGYDVVYAVRSQRKEWLPKRLLFAAFHRLMSAVASVTIPADAGIFSLIDRRVADRILAMNESDRYFPGLRSWVGFKQKGIVVPRGARYDGRPRVSTRGLFRLAKTAIFSFSSFPLSVFHVIGAAAAVVFVGLGGYALFCKLFTDLAIPGWTSYMLMGSFFGAINALGISILGEYVIRIHNQVLGRPQYVVDRTVNFTSSDAGSTGSAVLESADEPYADLLEQAEQLLQEGTMEEWRPDPAAAVVEPNGSDLFTLHTL
ncbi:MAG: glycosyltransferase family 2 protein [Pirellulales bacterium]|nr:glycosyltransferase family 2 protein [Pirellulales bacterium]